uniref:Uncharacterized protein n=1 Tax=Anopheles dirus TaxID=7168 RepID=A0A182N2X1_9DIPT
MEKQQARKHADVSNGATLPPTAPGGNQSRCSSSSRSSSTGSGSTNCSRTKKNSNPIKKEEKDTEVMTRRSSRNSDTLNPEHEMFMQAFESEYSASFKIDAMLGRKLNKLRTEKASGYALADGYLTLVFLGFYDDKNQMHRNGADSHGIVVPLKTAFVEGDGGDGDGEPMPASVRQCVQVETNLLKVAHTKRKDIAAIQMQLTVGKSNVLVNPREDELLLEAGTSNGDGDDEKPVVSIPTDSFSTSGPPSHMPGPPVSFILRFRVHCTVPADSSSSERYASDDGEEPSAKRQKLHAQSKLYSTELTVFDKLGRCLLTEADYELTIG